MLNFLLLLILLKFSPHNYVTSTSNEDDYACVLFILLSLFLNLPHLCIICMYTKRSQFALYIILFVVSLSTMCQTFSITIKSVQKRRAHWKIATGWKSRWNGDNDVKATGENPMPINRRINHVGFFLRLSFADFAYLRTYLEMQAKVRIFSERKIYRKRFKIA